MIGTVTGTTLTPRAQQLHATLLEAEHQYGRRVPFRQVTHGTVNGDMPPDVVVHPRLIDGLIGDWRPEFAELEQAGLVTSVHASRAMQSFQLTGRAPGHPRWQIWKRR